VIADGWFAQIPADDALLGFPSTTADQLRAIDKLV
jgi:hypothetical protein